MQLVNINFPSIVTPVGAWKFHFLLINPNGKNEDLAFFFVLLSTSAMWIFNMQSMSESRSIYPTTVILNILSTKCASLFSEKVCLKLLVPFFLGNQSKFEEVMTIYLRIFWDKVWFFCQKHDSSELVSLSWLIY